MVRDFGNHEIVGDAFHRTSPSQCLRAQESEEQSSVARPCLWQHPARNLVRAMLSIDPLPFVLRIALAAFRCSSTRCFPRGADFARADSTTSTSSNDSTSPAASPYGGAHTTSTINTKQDPSFVMLPLRLSIALREGGCGGGIAPHTLHLLRHVGVPIVASGPVQGCADEGPLAVVAVRGVRANGGMATATVDAAHCCQCPLRHVASPCPTNIATQELDMLIFGRLADTWSTMICKVLGRSPQAAMDIIEQRCSLPRDIGETLNLDFLRTEVRARRCSYRLSRWGVCTKVVQCSSVRRPPLFPDQGYHVLVLRHCFGPP